MTKQLKYILLALLVISCKNNSIDKLKKPDNLISKDKMVEVIYDISLINAAKGVNKKLIENAGIVPEDYIYKKHNIDSLQFALSNEYYAYNLKTYEAIYDSVKVKLEKDKKHFKALAETEIKAKYSSNKVKKAERDSLKNTGKLLPNRRLNKDSISPFPIKKIDTSGLLIRQ